MAKTKPENETENETNATEAAPAPNVDNEAPAGDNPADLGDNEAETSDNDALIVDEAEAPAGESPAEIEPIIVKGHHINGYEPVQSGGFNVKVSKEIDGEHQHRTLFIDVPADAAPADKLAAIEAQL